MARVVANGRRVIAPALFILFVVIGCSFIVAAKILDVRPAVVTLVPVAIMLAYALAQIGLRAARIRDDQAGDNLYYMGFLYTLTSLGVSLYQFAGDSSAETIVRNFGIAIGSTIAGVTLRVVFNQMRRDPLDVEQAARLELAEASRRVRRELDGTVVELSHFRRAMQQAVREAFEELQRDVSAASGKMSGSLSSLTASITKPVEETSTQSAALVASLSRVLMEKIEQTGGRLYESGDWLAAHTKEVANELQQTSERLNAVQMPDQVVRIQIEPIVAAMASSVEAFNSKLDAYRIETERVTTALGAARDDEARRIRQLDELIQALSASTAAMQEVSGRLNATESQQQSETFGIVR